MPHIIIYTKTGCPWCIEALAFLNEKKVSYEEREVRGNEVYFKELTDKSGQTKTPTLDVDGEILADTDAPAIEAFLKKKGILAE
ncbi:MAG: glutaredoxin family protein [Patescibacteria group bacterium]|nr:glutaredoxin family protein [Patescibacteria group bacterium]